MSSLNHYLSLLADEPRVSAFDRAIRRVVRRGDVVVDLGSGLGSNAVIAALAGARRVYAVEQDGVGRFALDLAQAAGVGERIVVVPGRSTEVQVPEPADVCIFDDFRALEPGGRAAQTMADARARWLTDAGTAVPHRVEIWAAPIGQLPRVVGLHPEPQLAVHGIDPAPLRHLAMSTPWPVWLASDATLLAAPRRIALDVTVKTLDVSGEYAAAHGGRVAGLVTWLVLRLTPRIALDAGPSAPRTAYPQGLFPLPEPFRVDAGDDIQLTMRYSTHAGAGKPHRLWSWKLASRHASSGATTFATMPLPTATELLGKA